MLVRQTGMGGPGCVAGHCMLIDRRVSKYGAGVEAARLLACSSYSGRPSSGFHRGLTDAAGFLERPSFLEKACFWRELSWRLTIR